MTYGIGNWSLGLRWSQICDRVKPVIGISSPLIIRHIMVYHCPSVCPHTTCNNSSLLCLLILYSYIFHMFSRFCYIFYICLKFPIFHPKILYFSKTIRKKSWIFKILSVNFILTWQIEALQDINADTFIVFSWSCIVTDTFVWLFYCWIFLGFKFTWLHIYFSIVVFCGTCPFL
jgi:hypothetical protein